MEAGFKRADERMDAGFARADEEMKKTYFLRGGPTRTFEAAGES